MIVIGCWDHWGRIDSTWIYRLKVLWRCVGGIHAGLIHIDVLGGSNVAACSSRNDGDLLGGHVNRRTNTGTSNRDDIGCSRCSY